MTTNRAVEYLAHIQTAAADVQTFVEGISFVDF